MKSSLILKKNRDFKVAYKSKFTVHSRSVILFYVKDKLPLRIGFVTSKKIGNSVYRNLAKRRLKAIIRVEYGDIYKSVPTGYIVIVVKKSIFNFDYINLNNEIKFLLSKVKLF